MYALSNVYNPLSNVTFIGYTYVLFVIYTELESKECQLDITNTWKCGKYVEDACTIDVSTTETYADKYGGKARINYTIKSTLDENYPECDCKEWNVDVSGETHKLSCERGRYDEHTVTETIELAPNNENKAYYVLTGKIITNRK